MACVERKADNETKINRQVTVCYAKRRDYDLTEDDWKFIKKQEWVWDLNERSEEKEKTRRNKDGEEKNLCL